MRMQRRDELLHFFPLTAYQRGVKIARSAVHIATAEPSVAALATAVQSGKSLPPELTLQGTVFGARTTLLVHFDPEQPANTTHVPITKVQVLCPCPARLACEHGVALTLALLEELNSPHAEVQPTRTAEPSSTAAPQARLALEFDFTPPTRKRSHTGGALQTLGNRGNILMRPMRRVGSTWNQLDFEDFLLSASSHRIGKEQYAYMSRLLRGLVRQGIHADSNGAYGLTNISEADFFASLALAASAGILLRTSHGGEVILADECAHTELTFARSTHTASTTETSAEVTQPLSGGWLETHVSHPDLTHNHWVRIGNPMQGIAWEEEGTLHLASLNLPASPIFSLLAASRKVPLPTGGSELADWLEPYATRRYFTYEPTLATMAESYRAEYALPQSTPIATLIVASPYKGIPPRLLLHWHTAKNAMHLPSLLESAEPQPPLEAIAHAPAELRKLLAGTRRKKKAAHRVFQLPTSAPIAQIQALLAPWVRLGDEYENSGHDVLATAQAGREGAGAQVTSVVQDLTLSGLAAARFVEETLPKLQALPLQVRILGELPAFREEREAEIDVENPFLPASAAGADRAVGAGGAAGAREAGIESADVMAADLISLAAPAGEAGQPQGKTDWFDLNITVRMGDAHVPMSTLLRALFDGDDALFLEDGQYVHLDTPSFTHLRTLLAEARTLSTPGSLAVPRVRQRWWEELFELSSTRADQWRTSLNAALGTKADPVPLPSGLGGTLRPYQQAGFEWMAHLRRAHLGGVLADDMGLGKTIQTIAMILDERETGEANHGNVMPQERAHHRNVRPQSHASERKPWLVVTPTSVVGNWSGQLRQFAPGLRVVEVEATSRRRTHSLRELAAHADVIVTSYTLVRMDEAEYSSLACAGLILDEAQFVKNPRSKTYQALAQIPTSSCFAITGTPMENNLLDLWAIYNLVAPGLLGEASQFQETYRKPIEKEGNTALLGRLRQGISPFLLRRTKASVAEELPPKIEQIINVDLEGAHRRIYERHFNHERLRVLNLAEDINSNRIEILSALTRLRQLALDPSLVEDTDAPSSKLEALMALLEQTREEGHRVLVFSQFTRFLKNVARALEAAGVAYDYLDGATRDRSDVIANFTKGTAPVFLISLKAGGVGLNLTSADYVILTDPWWNPAVEAQAIDRAHRIGQNNTVHVYRLVARGTIEEKVLLLQEKKREIFSALFTPGGAGAGVDAVLGAGAADAGMGAGAGGATGAGVGIGVAAGELDADADAAVESATASAGTSAGTHAPATIGGASLDKADISLLFS